ncbi:MAG: UDP-glucose dehydrogenase family protein, partial [Candidatus Angelobacter sp.]
MKIAVIGCGYVGVVTAACFAEIGHEVTCVDNDPAKITSLKAGKPTIYENFLSELLTRNQVRLTFGSSIPAAVRATEAIFIAVPTPAKDDGMPEMRFVEAVACEIAEALNGFKVIVQKSTVPVKSGEWLHNMISERRPDADFEVVSNPEFLREGTAVTDFLYADRVVMGCDSEAAAAVIRRIYDPLVCGSYCRRLDAIPRPKAAPTSPRLIETSRNSAELIKYASNAFLSMKISFINAIANVCEAVGADIEDVSEGVGADSRIGPRFLRAGLGYGGSCFPKDVAALRTLSGKWGCELHLLHEVSRVNEAQRRLFLNKIREAIG